MGNFMEKHMTTSNSIENAWIRGVSFVKTLDVKYYQPFFENLIRFKKSSFPLRKGFRFRKPRIFRFNKLYDLFFLQLKF